ncbi:MAG: iron-containing alcohol dehydrogenase [bacterium]
MLDGNNIQVGAGRYTQCHGALKQIGQEVSFCGKTAYIVTDSTVWNKTGHIVKESMEKSGVRFTVDEFEGPSTQKSFEWIAKRLRDTGSEVVVGLGGGKVIDIAKGAGNLTDRKIITAPTSAATCAAYAVLYVTYGEDGSVACSQFLTHEISAVLVDLDFVADNCPTRYLASGIADAMAKKPEFYFTMLNLGAEGMTATSEVATGIADYTYKNYMQKALQAIEDAKNKVDSVWLDDVICMNIMLTGMVSDLSTGGKQLAIAHNFYDAVCCLHKEARRNFLHGEIVGLAIPLQMAVNGSPQKEIDEAKSLLAAMGIPARIGQLGIDCTPETVRELIDYTHRKTISEDKVLYEKIKECMKVIM